MKKKLKIISEKKWLKLLADKSTAYSINTCRYDCRNFDWQLPQHRMKEHLLIFCEQGFLGLKLEDAQVRVEPGTMIWIPPGETRTLWGEKKRLSLHHYKLRFNLWNKNVEYAFADSSIVKKAAWEMLPYFQLLVKAHNNPGKHYYDWHIKALLSSLSNTFFNLPDETVTNGNTCLNNTQKNLIDNYININIQSGIPPRELAQELNLTLDYFSRLFKTSYGTTPQGYIKRERMNYASGCLAESNISVKELASELSYANVNLFCRQFKEITGMTPTQYRKNR